MSIIIIISFEKNINQKLQLSFLNKSTIRIIIRNYFWTINFSIKFNRNFLIVLQLYFGVLV